MQTNLKLILASKSPRRQELLKLMGLAFTLDLKEVNEGYPAHLEAPQIALYIAEKKASAFEIPTDALLITADTIVSLENTILGKPKDRNEAIAMLSNLAGKKHTVYTGVCLKSKSLNTSFVEKTEVYFREASLAEISYYVDNFNPMDKAGSYGIQDWWGVNFVARIEGSYTNVMGLPTESLYSKLKAYFTF